MRFKHLALTLTMALAFPAPARTQESVIVVEGLTVLDMTGAPPRPGTTIVIRDGRIADLYPTGGRAAPATARVLDLRGRYAIPGLIDAHAHLTAPFTRPGQQDTLSRFFLLGGITAIRDMAGNGAVLKERARAAEAGSVLSPRIFYSTLVAGPNHLATDRRVTDLGLGARQGRLAWVRSVAADSDAAPAAAAGLEFGSTGLKVYAELSPATLQAVVREAHAKGLKVWSHAAVVPAKPSDAIAAGVDVLSHAWMLTLEREGVLPATYGAALGVSTFERPPSLAGLFAQMRQRGTMLDATLVATRRLEQSARVVDGDLGYMRGVDAWSVEAVRQAHRAGVRLVAGTDVSGRPGQDQMPTLHDELQMYVEAVGLTPAQALETATRNAAEMLGADRDIGTIAPGKRADLLILEADPLADIRNTRRIVLVVKGGVGHRVSPPAPAGDSLDWRPSWPSTQMAILRGDPFAAGSFAFRFRMPGGYWIHPHRHPVNARIRVVSGTFLVGMGEALDSTGVRVLEAGGDIALGAGMAHFEGTRGETVVEVSGTGPWGVVFVDPTKDPGRAGAP